MGATVIRIPRWTYRLLRLAPGWRVTAVAANARILQRSHRFPAVYFVFGVRFLDTGGGLRELPEAAVVFVPSHVVHGWAGSRNGRTATVGHFHPGHPAHLTDHIAPA